jgi:hypothetical protein
MGRHRQNQASFPDFQPRLIFKNIRDSRNSIRSWHMGYLQPLRFGESGLAFVGGQKNLAFKYQGTSDVKEIYSPSTGLHSMSRGQFAGSIHGEIRQMKQGGASQSAVLRGGLLCPGLSRDKSEDQAAVGVSSHRRDSYRLSQ